MNTVQGFYFDTPCMITAEAPEALLAEALGLCARYEQLMSRFIEESDVWNLNHSDGQAVEVSKDTLAVLRCAESVREQSGGAFNIAVGAASKLWLFTGEETNIPSDEQLDTAAQQLRDFSISFDGTNITLSVGTSIDLGGIAKGYICDKVASFLRESGATSGLLNFGGNVTTVGLHPKGRPWQIGLQSPQAVRGESVFAAVESCDSAVVTSGVYERSFEQDGKLYHHILDPRTCRPAESDLVSVSVLSPDGMLADALATAILVLGSEHGVQLAHDFDAQVALLTLDDRLTYSQGMPLILAKQ